jgi:hypothetical protein
MGRQATVSRGSGGVLRRLHHYQRGAAGCKAFLGKGKPMAAGQRVTARDMEGMLKAQALTGLGRELARYLAEQRIVGSDSMHRDRVWLSCTVILPLREKAAAGSAIRPVAIGAPIVPVKR